MVSASVRLGGGLRPGAARAREPARHALDGDLGAVRRASTARPTRRRSATRRRTAASACASRTPNGCSSAWRSERRSSSSAARAWRPARAARRPGRGHRPRRAPVHPPRVVARSPTREATSPQRPPAESGRQAPDFTLERLDEDGELAARRRCGAKRSCSTSGRPGAARARRRRLFLEEIWRANRAARARRRRPRCEGLPRRRSQVLRSGSASRSRSSSTVRATSTRPVTA